MRDPAAVLVENQLRELARDNSVEVHFDSRQGGMVAVTFDSITAVGETRDIAVVRMASSLLDDRRFAPALVRILNSVVVGHSIEA
jgi:hypothetical protein